MVNRILKIVEVPGRRNLEWSNVKMVDLQAMFRIFIRDKMIDHDIKLISKIVKPMLCSNL